MPRGDKSSYTDKQKRKAEHIEEGYRRLGVRKKEAEGRAWATVNKESGGGNKSGSGRGVKDTTRAAKRGGRIGGSAAAMRPAAARSASAKKAAATRKRNAAKRSAAGSGAKRSGTKRPAAKRAAAHRAAASRKTSAHKTSARKTAARKTAKKRTARKRS